MPEKSGCGPSNYCDAEPKQFGRMCNPPPENPEDAMSFTLQVSFYGMNLFVFSQTRLDVLAVVLGMMAVLTYGMLRWSRLQGWW